MVKIDKRIKTIIFAFFINITFANILTNVFNNLFSHINIPIIFIKANVSNKLYIKLVILIIDNNSTISYINLILILKKYNLYKFSFFNIILAEFWQK